TRNITTTAFPDDCVNEDSHPAMKPVMFLLLLMAVVITCAASSSHGEGQVLLSLKAAMDDPDGALTAWTQSDVNHFCNWTCVACNGKSRIMSLDFTNMNLSGDISPEISRLRSLANLSLAQNKFSVAFPAIKMAALRFLNISNNNFTGGVPAEVAAALPNLETLDAYNNNFSGPLPLQVVKLANLRYLHLGGNYFTGSIPAAYGNFTKLIYLGLNGNALVGHIPAELGRLKRLQHLYLGHYNAYTGGIPAELGNLTNLIRLDISDCGITGAIPAELSNLRSLDSLFLHLNALTGPIPPLLGRLASLSSLDLSFNQLNGEIPSTFANLTSLTLLNLFKNRLHGSIPAAIGDLPSLEVISLWENNITGSIPTRLGLNGKLAVLDLSYDKLTGLIPPHLCSGNKLRSLILQNNFFFGPIPETLGSCKSLNRLRMGKNYLNGSIPAGLLNLPELDLMELQNNDLSGNLMPDGIEVSQKLSQLNLSHNRLTGSLPRGIGNFTGLQVMFLNGNDFTGAIPSEIGRLKQLGKMDLSGNRFSGQIPKELSQCKLLSIVDLSSNELTGAIPSTLIQMHILNYLNMSRNHLTGSIPKELEQMQSLTAVDFSYNNLSGLVPDSGQFSLFNASCFIGNPNLCGPYLGPCALRANSPTSNHVKGPISCTVKLILVVGLLLCSLVFATAAIIKARALKKNSPSRSWKLTAFQRLDFTCENVLECLKEENIIGKGGAGVVYKGSMRSGEEFAVKRLPGISRGSSNDHGFAAEIQTLGRIRHRHIVRLLGFCSNQEINLLVYEYMPNGSLGELLHGKKGGHLEWATRYKIAIEAAKGLCYLHHDCCPLIVHRDVKSNNILLDSDFEAHVADFGLAKFLQDSGTSECMSSIAGSYGYIAPEYAYTLKVDEKSDVYSFGVVLLELITGRRPVGDFGDGVDIVQWVNKMTESRKEGVVNILDQRLSSIPLHQVMHVFSVAMVCVEEQSVERPTMREVVQMLTDPPKIKPSENSGPASGGGETKESDSAVNPPDLLSI
ncbi:hypothetical protein KI387_028501, partial [Taxus chinensis]